MPISQNDAYLETAAVHQALVEAAREGVSAWRGMVLDQPAMAKPLDPTTRANFIHDHVTGRLEVLVEPIAGVVFDDALGFDALRVGSSVLLRIKYVGNGKPANVATTQQRLLAKQIYGADALDLLGLSEPPTLLTCGYTLDGLNLERVEIRMDCKGLQPWSFDIFGGGYVGEAIALPGLEDTARPTVVKSTSVRSSHQEAPEAVKR